MATSTTRWMCGMAASAVLAMVHGCDRSPAGEQRAAGTASTTTPPTPVPGATIAGQAQPRPAPGRTPALAVATNPRPTGTARQVVEDVAAAVARAESADASNVFQVEAAQKALAADLEAARVKWVGRDVDLTLASFLVMKTGAILTTPAEEAGGRVLLTVGNPDRIEDPPSREFVEGAMVGHWGLAWARIPQEIPLEVAQSLKEGDTLKFTVRVHAIERARRNSPWEYVVICAWPTDPDHVVDLR